MRLRSYPRSLPWSEWSDTSPVAQDSEDEVENDDNQEDVFAVMRLFVVYPVPVGRAGVRGMGRSS